MKKETICTFLLLTLVGCSQNLPLNVVDELGMEYDDTSFPVAVGDEFCYKAGMDGKKYVVCSDKIMSDGYDAINGIYDIDGQLGYKVKQDGVEYLIVGDEIVSNGYDSISVDGSEQKVIDGRLTYFAMREGKGVLVHGNTEIGLEYTYFAEYVEVGGKIAYFGSTEDEWFLVYDGAATKLQGGPFELVDVAGSPAYVYKRQIGGEMQYSVVHNNKEYGLEYNSVRKPVDINGKLAFDADIGDTHVVVYDGQEYGQEYGCTWFTKPYDMDGMLGYECKKSGGKDPAFVYGKTIVKGYDFITYHGMWDGEPIFSVLKGKKKQILKGTKVISRGNEDACCAEISDNKLAYHAKTDDGNKIVVVEP